MDPHTVLNAVNEEAIVNEETIGGGVERVEGGSRIECRIGPTVDGQVVHDKGGRHKHISTYIKTVEGGAYIIGNGVGLVHLESGRAEFPLYINGVGGEERIKSI